MLSAGIDIKKRLSILKFLQRRKGMDMIVPTSFQKPAFSVVPQDIVNEIAGYFEIKELGTIFARVCKQFYKVAESRLHAVKVEIEDLQKKYPTLLIQALGGPLKFYKIPKGNLGNYQGDDYEEFLAEVHRKMQFRIMRGEDSFLSKTKKVFLAFRVRYQQELQQTGTSSIILKVLIKTNTLPTDTFMDLDEAIKLYPYIGRLYKGEPCGRLAVKKHICFKKWVELSPKMVRQKSMACLSPK